MASSRPAYRKGDDLVLVEVVVNDRRRRLLVFFEARAHDVGLDMVDGGVLAPENKSPRQRLHKAPVTVKSRAEKWR